MIVGKPDMLLDAIHRKSLHATQTDHARSVRIPVNVTANSGAT